MIRLRRAATLALAGLLLAACGGPNAPSAGGEQTEIRVTVTNSTEPYVIPWLVGDDQGLFAAHGVKIGQIVAGQGGSTTLRNLVSGGLEVADVSFPAVVDGKRAGTPVTVVAGATRSVFGLDFYTTVRSNVRTPADAKRWAFTNPGSVTEALTYLVPKAAGVDPASIQHIAAGGVGEGIALLESGAADVAVIPPSVAAKDPGKYRLVAASADYLPAFQQSVLTVRDDYLAAHPTVVSGVIAGYQDAVQAIKRDPAAAARIYADYVGIDEAAAQGIVDAALKSNNWSAGLDAAALNNAVEAMRAAGSTADIPWCQVFNLSHLPEGASRELPVKCGGAS